MTIRECDLPSLKQILRAADSITDVPLTPAMARNWFRRTTALNKRDREEREARELRL